MLSVTGNTLISSHHGKIPSLQCSTLCCYRKAFPSTTKTVYSASMGFTCLKDVYFVGCYAVDNIIHDSMSSRGMNSTQPVTWRAAPIMLPYCVQQHSNATAGQLNA